MNYKGRIVEIRKYSHQCSYIEQGVKGNNQYKYSNYTGGKGTYVVDGEYLGTSLYVKIFIFDRKQCITFDIYDDVMNYLGKKRMSAKIFEAIKAHQGEKVNVAIAANNSVQFDYRQLL